jgi:predicted nuclease of predicted toxin-antitoxin system
MKFKIDENLPLEAAESLRQAGYDAVTVLEQRLGAATDSDVASICQQEARALITLDVDFADIRVYPPERFHGLVVFRLRRQDKRRVLSVLERLIPLLPSEPLLGHLWIVEEERVRIRG